MAIPRKKALTRIRPKTPGKPTRPMDLPHGSWLGDFQDLTTAEMALVQCCAQGEVWTPVGWNEKRPSEASVANSIRAELIRFLLLGGDPYNPVHQRGVMVRGGWIKGELNFHFCRAAVRLDARYCHFCAVPMLQSSDLLELVMIGSWVPGLNGQGMKVERNIFLRDGFEACGEVILPGAEIGGNLECTKGIFSNKAGYALNAVKIKVTGNVILNKGFDAKGEVRLSSAEIGGSLECTGGRFSNKAGYALNADRIKVKGNVLLRDGFEACGEVILPGAEIGSNLECTKGKFRNKAGNALKADGIKVTGNVFLRDDFTADGEVRLLGAGIGGILDCTGGKFLNKAGKALSADSMQVTGNVFLCDDFKADGEVRLLGAEIGGDLECTRGSLSNETGCALNAQGIKVQNGFLLSTAKISGAVSLAAARVGTLIDDEGCWQAGGHIFDGLHYDRIIGPTDAQTRIKWLKHQREDQLTSEDWKPQPWEQLIKVLREMGHSGEAAAVAMEKQRMMRAAGQIGTRQPDNSIEKPWRRWLDEKWNPISNWLFQKFHDFYGWIAGYGYRPTRIAGRMALVWLLCSLAFEAGREFGYLGPSNPIINTNPALAGCGAAGETTDAGTPKAFWHSIACPMPAEYSTLYPPLYSLDLILPLVDLQQDTEWAPIVINENGEQLFGGYVLRAMMWFEILFGWFASLMFVAIVSRLVDKD